MARIITRAHQRVSSRRNTHIQNVLSDKEAIRRCSVDLRGGCGYLLRTAADAEFEYGAERGELMLEPSRAATHLKLAAQRNGDMK